MKKAIQEIHAAISQLYQINPQLKPETFILENPPIPLQPMSGKLYLQQTSPDDAHIAIYFGDSIKQQLSQLPTDPASLWPKESLQAFCVASEELSHLHYIIFHSSQGHSISQLELEMQAEIDKFLLTLFKNNSIHGVSEEHFNLLFERIFHHFSLIEGLSEVEKERYLEANRLAKVVIQKLRKHLLSLKSQDKTAEYLRRFYRITSQDKLNIR